MDQSLQLCIGGLALLVGLQDDTEDIGQLLAATRHALPFLSLSDVLSQLLQQLLNRQGEGDRVASCTIAMPRHVRLLIKDGSLSPVLALHGQQDHACKARRSTSQLKSSHLFPVDPFQTIACPHVISIAEWRQPSCLEVLNAILADGKLALLAQHCRTGVILMIDSAAVILKGLAGVKR